MNFQKAKNENYVYVPRRPLSRLGNQMFLYATMYALAKRNGKRPVITTLPEFDMELFHVFTLSAPKMNTSNMDFTNVCDSLQFPNAFCYSQLYEEALGKFSRHLIDLPGDRNYQLNGHLQVVQ
jgi:hypothetical protein